MPKRQAEEAEGAAAETPAQGRKSPKEATPSKTKTPAKKRKAEEAECVAADAPADELKWSHRKHRKILLRMQKQAEEAGDARIRTFCVCARPKRVPHVVQPDRVQIGTRPSQVKRRPSRRRSKYHRRISLVLIP